jgi:Tol biopolymer transport system component
VDGLHVLDSTSDIELRGNRAEHNGDDGVDVNARLFGVAGVWSPDGGLIASSGVRLFAADGSGSRALVDGSHPSWSPDGTELAYQAADGVHVIGADGTGDRFLAPGGAPQWSPVGDRILVQDGTGIYTVDAAGGTRVLLARGTDPEWSPDGDRVVFQRDNLVLVVNADGTGETFVYEGGSPTWSPDGERILVTDGLDLVTVRTDGSDPQYLTTDEPVDYAPAWSPDGTQIAFLRFASGNIATYVVSATGGPVHKVADGDTPPIWAPDSERLLLGRTVWNADGSLVVELSLGHNPYVTLRGNEADDNTNLGIEAVDGVIDGGGNRASGNGDPRQCVGVTCS